MLQPHVSHHTFGLWSSFREAQAPKSDFATWAQPESPQPCFHESQDLRRGRVRARRWPLGHKSDRSAPPVELGMDSDFQNLFDSQSAWWRGRGRQSRTTRQQREEIPSDLCENSRKPENVLKGAILDISFFSSTVGRKSCLCFSIL